MKKTEYIIWYQAGMTAMAELTEDGKKMINPKILIGGLGESTEPGKTAIRYEIIPFLYKSYAGKETLEWELPTGVPFTITDDFESPVVEHYKAVDF